MKITVLDGYAANPGDMSWESLARLGELTIYDRTVEADTVKRACEADIVLTNKTVLDADVIERLTVTRYIGVLATGYNVVDIDAATRKGIIVTNIPAYSTDSVVQATFAHILNIVNRVDHYARMNREGRWCGSADFCYFDTPLTELAGKTLGIVGLGNIGSKVAKIAKDFGMKIYAYTSKSPSELPAWIKRTTIEGLASVSDIVTLHCPLTLYTDRLVNAEFISRMRHGAILINTSRGRLVDEQAVADALDSGQLSAFGADVLTDEPPKVDNPLLSRRNAYITPHIAWATSEARSRLVDIAVKNIKAFLEGSPVNVVNPSPQDQA